MSERSILIRNNKNITMPVFPKGRFAILIQLLSRKLQVVSNFVHKWARP